MNRKAVVGAAVVAAISSGWQGAEAQTAHFAGVQRVVGSGVNVPSAVAIDSGGTVYAVEVGARVRRYAPNGSGGFTQQSDVAPASGSPYGVAVDNGGTVYVTDTASNAIHRYAPNGSGGFTQQSDVANTGLNQPTGVAVDGSGTVYVADSNNNAVRRYAPNGSGGYTQQSDVANTGLAGPTGVALDSSGTVYVADQYNWAVHRYAPNGSGGFTLQTDVVNGVSRTVDVAVDGAGMVYVADDFHNRVSRFAPNGSGGYTSLGDVGSGSFTPLGVAVSTGGTLYIADLASSSVVQVQMGGVNFNTVVVGATSAAQSLTFRFDTAGTIAAPALLTQGATGLDFADAGTGSCTTNGVAHSYNAGDTCTVDVTFAPRNAGVRQGAVVLRNGSGAAIATGYVYGTGLGPQVGFGPPAQSVAVGTLPQMTGVALDASGNLYAAEKLVGAVHKYAPNGSGGYALTVDVVTGLGNQVRGVAIDGAGNVYVADAGTIHKYTPNGVGGYTPLADVVSGSSCPNGVAVDGAGIVYNIDYCDNAVHRYSPDGVGGYFKLADAASGLQTPSGGTVDGGGTVYVADTGNGAVHRYSPNASGGYTQLSDVANGLANPSGVGVDASGKVYIATYGDNSVHSYAPNGSGGYTSLGTVGSGLAFPYALAVDGSGDLFLADAANDRVVKLDYITAPSLNFGTEDVGSTTAPQTVTLWNNGNADLSLPIPGTGNNPSISANFQLNSVSLGNCPLTGNTASTAGVLYAGTNCTLPITFVPTAAGTITGSLILTDNNLNATPSTTQTITLSGFANPQLVVTTAIASASLTVNHAVTPFTPVTATGGTPPLNYSVSPALPAGLSMSSTTGAISGTPTVVSAAATYTVTVTDALSAGGTATFSLTVNGPVAATTVIPTTALTQGHAIAAIKPVAGSGGTAPLSYSVSPALPAGLSMNSTTGAISGTPTVASATATYTVTVTDVNSTTATATFSLTVNSAVTATQAVASTVLTIGHAAAVFTPVTGSGGTAPLSYSISPALPAGLSFSTTSGAITGTPTVAGSAVTYTVTVTDANSATATATFGLVVNLDTPVITFAIPGKTYGDAPFTVSATSNSTGSFMYSVVSGPATISGNTVTITGAGTVVVQAAQAAAGYYAAATANANFTVLAAQPALSFAAVPGKTYGDPAFAVTASSASSGAVTYTVVSGPAMISGNMVSLAGVGTVVLRASQAAAGNYLSATAATNITVASAQLTVTANDTTRPYGVANPTFTGTVTGAKYNDIITESFATSATITSAPGTYAIVPTASGLNLGSYTVTVTNGTLTIAKASTTTVLKLSTTTPLPNQSTTLTATVTPGTSGTPTGTVAFTDNGTVLQSVALTGATVTYSVTLPPGNHQIVATYSGDVNFQGSSSTAASGTVTVPNLDFKLTPPVAGQTISWGGTVSFDFKLEPMNGGYPGTVSLGASGLPDGATATLSQNNIAANAGPQTVTVVIKTQLLPGHTSERVGGAAMALLLLPLAAAKRLRRSRERLRRVLLAAVLVLAGGVAIGGMTGCGTGLYNLPPQTFHVTMTGTSGSTQHTAIANLVVQ